MNYILAFVWETQRKRPFGRSWHRMVDHIRTALQGTEWQTWIGLICLRKWTHGRIFQRWWTFGLDKMWRGCQLANELSASQEQFNCMELINLSVSWKPIIRYLVSYPCIYWTSLVLVHTQTQNTHLAFLHNTKYSFQSLHYRVADRNLTQLNTSNKCIWNKTYDHIHVIKLITLHTVTHAHFYQALTGNSSTIKY
jgi:hypothetical protein